MTRLPGVLVCGFALAACATAPRGDGAHPLVGTYEIRFCDSACSFDSLPVHGYVVLDSLSPARTVSWTQLAFMAGWEVNTREQVERAKRFHEDHRGAEYTQKGCVRLLGTQKVPGVPVRRQLASWGERADGTFGVGVWSTIDASYTLELRRTDTGLEGTGIYDSAEPGFGATQRVQMWRIGPVRYAACLRGPVPRAPVS